MFFIFVFTSTAKDKDLNYNIFPDQTTYYTRRMSENLLAEILYE